MIKSLRKHVSSTTQKGFTIVELLIVVVVIAILAAITIVSFNGIQSRALESSLKTDLKNSATQLGIEKTLKDKYPTSLAVANDNKGINSSPDTTLQYIYRASDDAYCLVATSKKSSSIVFSSSSADPTIKPGACLLPTIVISHGPFQSCGSDACYRIAATISNFTAGSYSVRCVQDDFPFTSASNYTLPASGTYTFGCYAPVGTANVGIDIAGVGKFVMKNGW